VRLFSIPPIRQRARVFFAVHPAFNWQSSAMRVSILRPNDQTAISPRRCHAPANATPPCPSTTGAIPRPASLSRTGEPSMPAPDDETGVMRAHLFEDAGMFFLTLKNRVAWGQIADPNALRLA